MSDLKHVLVIRMSALGDVAMTIPVLYSVAGAYPQTRFTVLTQRFPARFFINPPANVTILGVDLKKEYPGVKGILRLAAFLRKQGFDAVADLHDVLRSKCIRILLQGCGVRSAHIDKGRTEKKALVRASGKIKKPLRSSFDRYAEVFYRLGFHFENNFKSVYEQQASPTACLSLTGEKSGRWIGIAPFAKHGGKIYPQEQCEALVKALANSDKTRVFLFGAGPEEQGVLEAWESRYPGVLSIAGKLNITDEIALMSRLDAMVSMDSANMHLASLTGTPVVSIWGATHPYAGFMGWGQQPENAIGLDLECRPCSVFGNKPCLRGDYACMTRLEIAPILKRINEITATVVG